MDLTYDSVKKEQDALEKDRKDYESLKRLCCDLAYPDRIASWEWLYASSGIQTRGYKRTQRVYDATAMKGFEIWSNGIIGNWMPKDISWFTEQMADRKLRDSKHIITWLQETDEHMRFVLNQSGGLGSNNDYYSQKIVSVRDAGCIGDSFTFIDEDKESGKLMFLTPHPREFWVKRDYWGRVTVIHHKTIYTLQQIVDEFGKKGLTNDQQLTLETTPNQTVSVIHGVYKNKDYEPSKPGVKNMPWQHVYINVEGKLRMKIDGSETLNPIPWSLNRPTGETYGRGIVAQLLIEILTANFIAKDLGIASQTAVRPPMLLTSAIKHKVDMGAGAINFVGSREMQGLKMGDLVARLLDNSGYPFGVDNHERWTKMVEDRFGVSLFLAFKEAASKGQSYKNIEHVRYMQSERIVLMAPFLSTLGSNTDLEFDRVYSLELNAGRAPEVPQEVLEAQNGRVDIQYIGPLHQLLKQYYETGNLLNTIANIQAVLSVAPDSSIIVEGDELMRKILRSGNTPEEIILSPVEAAEIRAIAAQREEEQRQMELAAKAAAAVPNLGKKIDSDSILGKVA